MQLTATVAPATANQTVTWSSSNKSVMTVSASGYVTAIVPGTARITATTGNGKTGYVDLTVPYDAATGVTVTAPQSTLAVGSGMQLTATVAPATANQTVTWSSSDTAVLTVSETGYVTAVAVGTAHISATAVNATTGTIDLTVPYPVASKVDVTAPQETVAIGKGMQLTATVSPAMADQSVTWNSSDADIMTVSASGYVTAVALGTARITATTGNGKTGYVDLTVPYDAATGVTVTTPQSTLTVTGTAQLTSTVSPAIADQAVTWSSSDDAVATVSASGFVTAIAAGNVRMTAKAADGLMGFVDLTILYDAATKVLLSVPATNLALGSSMELCATVYPATADQAVTWSSSDEGIATVSISGSVTPVAVGAVRITSTTVNGLTAFVEITVTYAPATNVSVTAPKSSVSIGTGMQLSANVSPVTADQAVTWSSSNTGIMTVTANGYVTAVAPGAARITATAANGKAGFVDLTVEYAETTGVTITTPQTTMTLGTGMQLSATVAPATARQSVTWTSSHVDILTVSAGGYVMAVAPGTARITATTENGVRGTVDITVVYATAIGVTVTAPQTELLPEGGMLLTSTVFPAIADQTVTWTTSDKGVLTISANGYVTAIAPGNARVTAKAVNGLTGYVDLTVNEAPSDFPIDTPRTSAPVGIYFQLYPQIPTGVSTGTRIWKSSDPTVMTVDLNGVVRTVSPGSARITLTVASLVGYIDLMVTDVVPTSIKITSTSGEILLGSFFKPAATVLPADANLGVTWTSSNQNVLSPTTDGSFWAQSIGTARITATTVNGLTDSIDVTVVGAPPATIQIVAPKTIVEIGEAMQLATSITPTNADPSVKWTTSDPHVLTVSGTGLVTGLASGTARVTAQASNGLTSSVNLTVGARISDTSIIIGKRQKWQLSVSGGAGTVVWSSANTKIARVSSTGLVEGVKYGTTEITASIDGLNFTCSVLVAKPSLSQTSVNVSERMTYKLRVAYASGSVRWSSSRTSIATVNKYGKITARRAGTATITATVDGFRLKCTVRVKWNGHSYYVDMNTQNYEYGASIATQKIYYKGSSIYVDVYIINNYSKSRIYRINNLKMWVRDEETDTLLAYKKFTSIYTNLKPGYKKKITLRFYGSATKMKAYELRFRTQSVYTSGGITLK